LNLASATINLRWTFRQVLGTLGDMRAEPVLAKLHADIQQRASELTDITDRDRLVQAPPVFRNVVTACQRMRGLSAPTV
jgi:hypothetical protein